MTSGPIDRASAIDMMELATATTPAAGQVGAVLVLASVPPLDLDVVRSTLADRIAGVPRLRQRLCPMPLGCGRPIWVDDASFDIANHVNEVRCTMPGDRSALLAVAADLVARRLPPDLPLWSASLVTGLAEDTAALVLIFHHVMADGIGGLAVLANLVDGAPSSVAGDFPRAPPSRTRLFADAMRWRMRSVAHLQDGIRRVRDAAAELGAGARMPRAPRCSLNRPVGPRRCLAVAQTSLDAVHAAAHQHGASVNDAVLAAITGAVAKFLHEQREEVDHFVVSIPISGREVATAARLGNEVGVMPVTLPATGAVGARIEAIAAITRARKQVPRAASVALLAPALRVLAATRTLNWFTTHQRMVTTFVTNLRGPDSRVAFMEATVTEIIPVNGTSGNVRVAFGVFSYAGSLTVTVVGDASIANGLPSLVASLQAELDGLSVGDGDVVPVAGGEGCQRG
jgi:diacylglycerol O-acyltransferase / wax synthase